MTDATEVDEGDGYNPDDPEDSRPDDPWHVAFVEWVQTHFATVEFLTAEPKIRWCATWWVHTEVVARLTALWSAYLAAEAAEGEDAATAKSNWWLNHWDEHRAILFHDKGPFRKAATSNTATSIPAATNESCRFPRHPRTTGSPRSSSRNKEGAGTPSGVPAPSLRCPNGRGRGPDHDHGHDVAAAPRAAEPLPAASGAASRRHRCPAGRGCRECP